MKHTVHFLHFGHVPIIERLVEAPAARARDFVATRRFRRGVRPVSARAGFSAFHSARSSASTSTVVPPEAMIRSSAAARASAS